MARTVTIVYTVLSILAFVALISWLANAYIQIKSENLLTAANTFQDVRRSVAATVAKEGGFDTSGFRSSVRSLFLEDPMIQVLSVTTQTGGVQYIFARQASDLTVTRASDREWDGAFRYDKVTQHLFSAPLPLPSARPRLIIRSVFGIVGREDLYALARVVLISLMSFVILTGIVILLMPLFGRRTAGSASRGKPSIPSTPESRPDTSAAGPAPVGDPAVGRDAAQPSASTAPSPPAPLGADRGEPVGAPPEVVAEDAETSRRVAHEPPSPQRGPGIEGDVAEALQADTELPDGGPTFQDEAGDTHPPGADELPPGIDLPTLEEVSGGEPSGRAAPGEISLFEELRGTSVSDPFAPRPLRQSQVAGDAAEREVAAASAATKNEPRESIVESPLLEITEVQEPPPESGEARATASVSAGEELADIEDFEDLEEIDGHRSAEPYELKPSRPRPPATAIPSEVRPQPEPEEPQFAPTQPADATTEAPRAGKDVLPPSPLQSARPDEPGSDGGPSASEEIAGSEGAATLLDEGEESLRPRAVEQTVASPDIGDLEPLEPGEEEEGTLLEPDIGDLEPLAPSEEESTLLEPDNGDLEPLAPSEEEESALLEPDLGDLEPLALSEDEERALLEPDVGDSEPLALSEEEERALLEPDVGDSEPLALSEEEERALLEPDIGDSEPLALSEDEERALLEPAGLEGQESTERKEETAEAGPTPDTVDHGPAPRPSERHDEIRELFDPETGLVWQDHLEQRLSFELDRAAAFDQDLSVCIVRFARQEKGPDRLNYSRDIRASFPFHDLCFAYGRYGLAIVLPNTDIDQAIRAMENFQERLAGERPRAPRMVIGLSARNGRLLGGDRLLEEAETALLKARQDRKNSIFALRVDPGKYREFIKSTLR